MIFYRSLYFYLYEEDSQGTLRISVITWYGFRGIWKMPSDKESSQGVHSGMVPRQNVLEIHKGSNVFTLLNIMNKAYIERD